MMLDHTCDHLKEHVEEEMLATSVDEGMSVESPELHLFVLLFIYLICLFVVFAFFCPGDYLYHLFLFLVVVCLFNLFVSVQDERVINGEIIDVVVPTKRPPFSLDANVVIDEKSNLQQSYAHDENWTVALFLLNPHLVSHFLSQG